MIAYIILQIGEKTLDSRKISFCNFGNDIALIKERQKNGFIDETLSGKFSLFGEAFSEINRNTSLNAPVCSMGLFGANNKEIYRGKFTWADCEIDYDNKIITINSLANANAVSDEFDEILNEEINVLELKPESALVKCWHNAILQIDIRTAQNMHSRHAINWANGAYSDCELDTSADFSKANFGYTDLKINLYYVIKDIKQDGKTYDFKGLVNAKYSDYVKTSKNTFEDIRGYKIELLFTYTPALNRTLIEVHWIIPNGSIVKREQFSVQYKADSIDDVNAAGSAAGSLLGIATKGHLVYYAGMRLLTRVDRGVAGTKAKTDSDPDNESNFNYAAPITLQGIESYNSNIYLSLRTGNEPSPWGIAKDGIYYYPPDDSGKYIPLSWDLWDSPFSLWLDKTINADKVFYDAYSKGEGVYVHGYKLTELIKIILDSKKIGFRLNSKYSPEADFNIFAIPVSNVTRFPYAKPASQFTVSLKKLLDVYCTVTNSEYFLSEKELIIQSKYLTNRIDGYLSQIDLSANFWSGTYKKISFGQNNLKALELPASSTSVSYQAERVADIFASRTYYNSDNLKNSNSESIQIGCEVDIANGFIEPSRFSETSANFFIVAVNPSNNTILTNSATAIVPGGQAIDNLRLSPEYLLYKYWKYYLGCSAFNVHGAFKDWDATCYIASPVKSATYKFPIKSIEQIDFFKAITTDLGKGLINKLTINLIDYSAEAELKFN